MKWRYTTKYIYCPASIFEGLLNRALLDIEPAMLKDIKFHRDDGATCSALIIYQEDVDE